MGQAATEDEPTLSTSISRHLRKGGQVVFGIIAAGRGPSRLCRLSDVLQAAGNGVRSGFIFRSGGLGVLGEEPPVFLELEHHFGWLVCFDVRVRIHKMFEDAGWRCCSHAPNCGGPCAAIKMAAGFQGQDNKHGSSHF